MFKSKIIRSVFILITIVYISAFGYYQVWKEGITSGADEWGYYVYLPATFIYKDLKTLDQSLAARHHQNDQSVKTWDSGIVHEALPAPNGNRVIKYTAGIALLQAPCFAIAHGLTYLSGQPTTGYSFGYMFLVHLGLLIWVLVGLGTLAWILLRYFDEKITALVLICIALGTNLLYFSLHTMSHGYLFSLYVFLMYATIRWYETAQLKYALWVGIWAGWITLARPVEMLCVLIPIGYNLTSWEAVKMRFQFVWQHKFAYLAMITAFLSMSCPQLLYWRYVSGKWLYYSYNQETFDFKHPHIWEGLFSFQNGWFAYAPLCFLGILGILLLLKHRTWAWVILLILPIHIYITYSWWCWQYIRGLGSRPMVDIYALVAIPLGYFLYYSFRWKLTRALVGAVVGLCIVQNFFLTYQIHALLIFPEVGNWTFYKRTFAKTALSYEDLVTFDTDENQPDSTQLQYIQTLAVQNFEDSANAACQKDTVWEGNYAFRTIGETAPYSAGIKIPATTLQAQAGNWLRISVWARRNYKGLEMYSMSMLVASFENPQTPDNPSIKWRGVRIDNKIKMDENTFFGSQNDVWGEVHYWTQVPDNLPDSSLLSVFVMNNTPKPIWVDHLKIELWKKR